MPRDYVGNLEVSVQMVSQKVLFELVPVEKVVQQVKCPENADCWSLNTVYTKPLNCSSKGIFAHFSKDRVDFNFPASSLDYQPAV